MVLAELREEGLQARPEQEACLQVVVLLQAWPAGVEPGQQELLTVLQAVQDERDCQTGWLEVQVLQQLQACSGMEVRQAQAAQPVVALQQHHC